MPAYPALLLPVLLIMADGADHRVEEMRERTALEFELTPEELARKLKSGSTVFVNRVAFALAKLNMAKAINRVEKGIYRVSERGSAILNRNPSELTLRDLRDFRG